MTSLLKVGRPYMYGLCLAGEAGVTEQVRNILTDFEVTLGLSGYVSVEEIQGNREVLSHVARYRS